MNIPTPSHMPLNTGRVSEPLQAGEAFTERRVAQKPFGCLQTHLRIPRRDVPDAAHIRVARVSFEDALNAGRVQARAGDNAVRETVLVGTPLQPPYVVLIAVEWSDVAKAQDIVKSITDQLVERDRFKMPRATASRL